MPLPLSTGQQFNYGAPDQLEAGIYNIILAALPDLLATQVLVTAVAAGYNCFKRCQE